MAKNTYNEKIDINVDWGGDASTGNLPVAGNRVQEIIKETLNSKAGFVGMVEKTGMYVLAKDETTYLTYLETITDDNPKGDQTLIVGEFRAPFEYSASVEILSPTNGYAVILEGTTGNVLKFRPSTKDASGAPVGEAYSYTITFRNGGNVQTYNGRVNRDTDVELNIDKYLSKGSNNISVMITGQDTGVSAFKSAEVRILEISLVDSFKISNVYNLKETHSQLTVNYKVKSTGPTTIKWYIDNELVDQTMGSNFNTDNGVMNIRLERGKYTQGVHSLRFYMECEDTVSNDIFRTDIFHRDFFVITGEDQTEPMITMSFDIPYQDGFIEDKKAANIFDAVQYENINLKFSVYFQGKASCDVNVDILKPGEYDYITDASYITKNGDIYTHELPVQNEGTTTVRITADGVTEYTVGPFYVQKSDMNIAPVEDNVILYFDANGRTNSSATKDVWEYTDAEGKEYKVKFNNFAWSPTNGWNNDKLVIARGSSIDIDFQPFADPRKIAAGATFEFEFNTTNVYNDDAVICNLCDDSGEPGIIITATEAKFIIKKGMYGPDSDTSASTKFKSGENNRISFVITPRGEQENRGRFVKVYVNGVICGAVVYDYNANLSNNKKLHFEGTDGAEIELASIRFYSYALNNDEILDNYIFFRNDVNERIELYRKNNIYDANNVIDIDAIKQQIPVMLFKQRLKSDGSGDTEGKIEDIETEYKDKKKTVYFDIEYENLQDPTLNFKVERARVTPQGTSSMKYPKKNFRFYTAKDDDTVLYDYEGNVVSKRKYSFKHGSAPVKCWCLKADFAESSGTHNTGTARFWNTVLKEAGLLTKAQAKAKAANYKYDVRTTVDGFPIVLFYQEVGSTPRFIGKYNFNNDKSTEDVFGFTGGPEVEEQEYKYLYVGKDKPIRHYDDKKGEWSCTLEENAYTETPNEDSPLYTSDNDGNWYMLRGKEMFDNPRMECWEMLDSGALIGLFKTVDGFGIGDDDEKVGRYYTKVNDDGSTTEVWEETFESRFPDCGDYYHTGNLRILCEWMVSCIYLKIDANGKAVNMTDAEIVEMSKEDTLTIHNITQRTDIPVSDKQRELMAQYGFENYNNPVILPNTAENRKEKFRVEKYNHFDIEKMAAYYIYLMRFGGVDQVVKNAMLTTEGSDDNEGHPEWPSKWYYINYDNDTIMGVKNNGHLVFDPYITRETKETGGAFAYAGRESTMWNNLENDSEFNSIVSTVDEKLHTLNGLSYINAIDMYNNKQAGQWCERVYNMDAQYKYIDSYVSPTISETSGSADLDYLFDVQGPRSAHRKWWLSKRFNIFDSKFVTGDFLGLAVVLKVQMDDVLEDKNVVLTSGEDIYYAIGGNNGVYYITPEAVLSGNDCFLPIVKGTQIGTPISIYGAPNIEKLDFRNMTQYLNQLELTNLYAPTIGTKLKKLYIGNKDNPVINSVGDFTISGFGNLEKCEEMDFTALTTMGKIDDLNKLKNLRYLYAAGTSISSLQFADGCVIEKLEAPSTIQTLIMNQLPNMTFEGLEIFDIKKDNSGNVVKTLNNSFGNLTSLTIKECTKMMNKPEFIFNWLRYKKNEGKDLSAFTLVLDGIDWTFDTVSSLSILAEVGTGNGNLNLSGRIHINKLLSKNEIAQLQAIFGKNCFEPDAQLRITAVSAVYIVGDDEIVEGSGVHKYNFIRVNLASNGTFTAMLKDNMGSLPDESYVKYTISNTECTIEVLENNSTTNMLVLNIEYRLGIEVKPDTKQIAVRDRIYPDKVIIDGPNDLGETIEYSYEVKFESALGEVNGVMEYEWFLTGEATELNGSRPYLNIKSTDGNKCTLILNSYFDGFAELSVNVTRKYDGKVLFIKDNTKFSIFLADPSTILTPNRNPEVYNIFLNAGLVPEGREKITKGDAMLMTEGQIGGLFKGHGEIKSFNEFQFFTGVYNIPNDMFRGCSGMTSIVIPSGIMTICDNSFSGCTKLTAFSGGLVNKIGANAFTGCESMVNANFTDALEMIGNEAFRGCKRLTDFHVSSSISSIAFGTNMNAFQNCQDITFDGGNDEYLVDNGNLYHIDPKTNAVTLLHMGKGNTVDTLIKNVNVDVVAYAMEYRTEPDLVVPTNLTLKGSYIFNGSEGNSITLTNVLDSKITHLFSYAKYGDNYRFAPNETIIPSNCFTNNESIKNFVVPEGITTLAASAFYPCNSLQKLTLPTTLTKIETKALWLVTKLKEIYFKGSVPPSITNDDMFNVLLDGIYVYPEYYDTWKANFNETYAMHLAPWYLYEEGYVRIIQDGQVNFYGNTNDIITNITIGGINPTQMSDGYMKYVTNGENINNLEIKVNDKVVGKVQGNYTTIYLGDNTSLFTGDGLNFTKGIFNTMVEGVWPNGNNNNWYYDAKLGGLRSNFIENGSTSLKFKLNNYVNKNIPIVYTFMGHLDKNTGSQMVIFDNNGALLHEAKGVYEINNLVSVTASDGEFTIQFNKSTAGIEQGIDGIVVYTIGNSIYSDPEINTMMLSLDEPSTNCVVKVELNANCLVNGALVKLTDNKSVEYSKIYNGEPIYFVVPKDKDYVITASAFVNNNKLYNMPEMKYFSANMDNINIVFDYEVTTGLNIENNVLTCMTSDADYLVYVEKQNGVWGKLNINMPEIETEDIFVKDTDGYTNTKYVLSVEGDNSMFGMAYNSTVFGNDIDGYIPSYIEMTILGEYLDVINDYLTNKGYEPLNFENCWTADAYDSNNAWTSDGEITNKDNVKNFYIFGKRIMN